MPTVLVEAVGLGVVNEEALAMGENPDFVLGGAEHFRHRRTDHHTIPCAAVETVVGITLAIQDIEAGSATEPYIMVVLVD